LGLPNANLKIKILLQALKDAQFSINECNTKIDYLKGKFRENHTNIKSLKDDHVLKKAEIKRLEG